MIGQVEAGVPAVRIRIWLTATGRSRDDVALAVALRFARDGALPVGRGALLQAASDPRLMVYTGPPWAGAVTVTN